jgi:hypothetical protein
MLNIAHVHVVVDIFARTKAASRSSRQKKKKKATEEDTTTSCYLVEVRSELFLRLKLL